MSNVIKDQIVAFIQGITAPKTGVRNPDRKHNVGPALFDVFVWQEISSLADKELKAAWGVLADEGLLKPDDQLRALGAGEHIATESDSFSCLVKVSAPRKTLDKEAFLTAVARKARISREYLDELWDEHQKEGKASLTKRVLEV